MAPLPPLPPPLSGKFLLTLPRSDVASTKSKSIQRSTSVNSGAGGGRRSRPDLVLFQVPSCMDEMLAGKCQILANHESASLVSPTQSIQLVTVGTSNSLVVWKRQSRHQEQKNTAVTTTTSNNYDKEENKANNEDEVASSKRAKTVTSCRLIQPGGSGASFLVGQTNPLRHDELLHFFAPNGGIGGASFSPLHRSQQHHQISNNNKVIRRYSTSTLSNLFQCSDVEMEEALSQIPTIVAFGLDGQDRSTNSPSPSTTYWQVVPDEEVLSGQQALVQMLVEEDDNDEERDEVEMDVITKLDQLTNKVSERLLPILLEHESEEQGENSHDDEALSGNRASASASSRTERSKAIARKTILLAEKTTSNTGKKRHPNHCRISNNSKSIRVDPSIIVFYVLRDMFISQPSYEVSDFIKTWTARLPFGDDFERIVMSDDVDNHHGFGDNNLGINTVTMEWLKDHKIIPDQLVIIHQEHKTSSKDGSKSTNTTTTTTSVIQLATPGTVLTWHA
jgi:hypothetical protein